MRRVVVTGGAGFIGANLCRALAGLGTIEVIAYDNLSTGNRSNLPSEAGVTLAIADILDTVSLERALRGAESVVHLAARPSVPRSLADPFASHEANATGTLRVLQAAHKCGVGQVVVASSSSVYGANLALPKVETMKPSPLSPYAVSKLATEAYALAWQHSFGLPTLAFRFFNVFGQLQPAGHAYAAVVPQFISSALVGEPLSVHGDGNQTRDFTHVDSVVAVLIDAIQRCVTDIEPINLAFGTRSSLLDLIGVIERLLGHSLERVHCPARAGDVRDSQADSTRLRNLFPTVPPVTLEEGLRSTIEWMKSTPGNS